jgi:hypothetical protein
MKRKLISFDQFKNMENNSISKIEKELIEAEEMLSSALDDDKIELMFFNENEVVYKNQDHDLIKSEYKINKDNIVFENIEKLIIDEESEVKHSKELISKMVENIIDGKESVAEQIFGDYLNLPLLKRTIAEGYTVKISNPKKKRSKLYRRKQPRSLVAKRIRAGLITKRKRKSQKTYLDNRKRAARKRIKNLNNPRARLYTIKTMKEWNRLADNVHGYVNYKEMGTLYKECVANFNEKGDIIGIKIPTTSRINEGKVLDCDWKTLDTEVKVLRKKAKSLSENEKFIKNVYELNRFNNISDNDSFSTVLENLVGVYPEVLYLSLSETNSLVKNCLESANARNFDDNSCEFLSEAILRTAFEAYSDRASRIASLAGVKLDEVSEDNFAGFKDVCESFFKHIDEVESADYKVFEDLQLALENLVDMANKSDNKELAQEAHELMKECIEIVNGEKEPDIYLAEFIANYLKEICESNLSTQNWNEPEAPVVSVTGEHPSLSAKARQSYSPAGDLEGDDVDSPAPVSDGKSIKNDLDDEMRMDVFSSMSDEDSTWPSLKNPYVPNSMEYTMKNEKGVDKDHDGLGTNQSDNTYPNLRNPLAK